MRGDVVSRSRRIAVAAACLALAAGCALAPVEGPPLGGLMPVSTHVPPRDTARHAAAAPAPAATDGVPVPPAFVPRDSAPSPEAREVLATLPDPLRPEERVPPPVVAAPDSAAPESAAGEVPVPEPTAPLGDRPAPAVETGGAAPPPAGSGTPARPDTCWRVQVGAPATLEEAEQRRAAAQSLLVVEFTVESGGGLFKVRTRECVPRSTALALRDRAIDSGFAGAFPIAIVRR